MNDASAPSPQPPQGLLAKIKDFVNNMDARAWRVVAVTTILFVIVGVMLVVSRLYFKNQIEDFVRDWLGGAERAHWGLPAAVAIFTLTSFFGAPQFVLIVACVVAFGPERGFWYAWISTIVAAAIHYWLGKLGSAETVRRFGGATGGRFTRFMGKNAFLASFLIRNVPSAPFIVVNMAFGAAGVGFWPFLFGMALGVLPKTAIVAFGGDVIMDALEGKAGATALWGILAVALWFGVVVVIRRFVARRKEANTVEQDNA
ncbi:MAG TPA: VTT domain-containing protein [Caulobacterales bacterium]|nr:VTT domain-containing protein [Caulobacterales bacterium]